MITANIPHTVFKYPVGEMQVKLNLTYPVDSLTVWFHFHSNEEIIELMLLADAAKRAGLRLDMLTMPYVPFGRQDRVTDRGECFSLAVFANLLNSLEFATVLIDDPHSDVSPALIKNVVVRHQWDLLSPFVLSKTRGPFWLVSPDAGALKKTYKLAQTLSTPRLRGVIEASKKRDTATGDITGTHAPDLDITLGSSEETYVMVDDICDGGRTFIELAKSLRAKGAAKIHLYVTHGFFTKGKQVFDGLIDQVHAFHDYTEKT